MKQQHPRSAYSFGDTDITSFRPPKSLSWPRRHLAALLQAKSGHGDFADYHMRFGAPERAKNCHLCGEATQRLYPLECPLLEAEQRRFLVDDKEVRLKPQDALEHLDAFLAYVTHTGAYERRDVEQVASSLSGSSAGSSTEQEEEEEEASSSVGSAV